MRLRQTLRTQAASARNRMNAWQNVQLQLPLLSAVSLASGVASLPCLLNNICRQAGCWFGALLTLGGIF